MKIAKDEMQPGDIAVYSRYTWNEKKQRNERNGHVVLFVGWTSGHEMVWAEMKNHKENGKVSSFTPANQYIYKKYGERL